VDSSWAEAFLETSEGCLKLGAAHGCLLDNSLIEQTTPKSAGPFSSRLWSRRYRFEYSH